MGKFIYAVLSVIVIEISLFLFAGTTYTNSSLFTLFQDPSALTQSAFYLLIAAALTIWAASTIIPGNLWQINIYALYAGIAIILLGFIATLSHFWIFINGELSGVVSDPWIFASIMTFPLIVYYLLAVSEWVRSNT